jgi:hypothetical protein
VIPANLSQNPKCLRVFHGIRANSAALYFSVNQKLQYPREHFLPALEPVFQFLQALFRRRAIHGWHVFGQGLHRFDALQGAIEAGLQILFDESRRELA